MIDIWCVFARNRNQTCSARACVSQQQVEEEEDMVVRRQMSSTLPLCVLLGPLRDHRPHTHLTPPSPDQMDRSDNSSGRCGRTCTGHPLQPHISLLSQTCLEKNPPSSFPSGSDIPAKTLNTTHGHTNTHQFFTVVQQLLKYLGDLKLLSREKPPRRLERCRDHTHTFDSTGGRNHGESLPKKTRALPSDPD